MIIYEGPSLIDGTPIVAIVTGLSLKSKNPKTGEMPQIWVLLQNQHPMQALKTGEDKAICGNCPHRPKVLGENAGKNGNRSCYVKMMSVGQVWKKYKREGYPRVSLTEVRDALAGHKVRVGAYGDPCAVPIEVWDTVLSQCSSTGYTHGWRECDERFSEYVMASCDSVLDVMEARLKNYRTFYVQQLPQVMREVNGVKFSHCPAAKEMGKKTTCQKCMACSGTRSGLHSNVTIRIH